jgi:uncharacterized protein involved in outer membrane biogenesis
MALSPTPRRFRLIRIIALAVGGVIVLVVAGIAIVAATFDPDAYKPQIVAAVQTATGREVKIGGRIGLSLFSLSPTLEVSDVSFSNPPGFSRPQMATLQKLELQLSLIPLLSKQVEVSRLVLDQPDILLETNAKGQNNWDFAPAGTPGAAPPPPPPPASGSAAPSQPPSIALSSLKIAGGTIAMRDAKGKTTALGLKALAVTASSPDSPVHVSVDATYNGAPVGLTADTGPLSALMGSGSGPWPVKLAVTAASAKFAVDGTIANPAAGQGLALAVTSDIPDLAALSPLAGSALPPIKDFTAAFKLADMAGGKGYAVTDLKLVLPKVDLAGAASLQTGARPLITANLSAKQIDLDAVMKSLSSGAPAAPAKPAPAAAPALASGHVIPDTKLPLDALRQVDADIQLSVEDLVSGGQEYKALKVHLVLKDGRLAVDPLTVNAPGGQIDLKLTVDAKPAAPPVTLTLRAPSLALETLLKAMGKPGVATGTLEVRADLRGAGDSPHAIAASLDGQVGVALSKGEMSSQILGGLMSGLMQNAQIGQLASKAGMSALNCFALRLDASKGVGTLRALKLDSSTLGLEGTGGMNFGSEALDLHLKPMIGIAGTDIAAPVIVTGSFAAPSVRPDPVGLVTGNAGTAAKLALGASTGGIGLMIGSALERKMSGDPCAEPLALARFGPAPAAGAAPASGGGAPAASSPAGGAAGALKKLFP